MTNLFTVAELQQAAAALVAAQERWPRLNPEGLLGYTYPGPYGPWIWSDKDVEYVAGAQRFLAMCGRTKTLTRTYHSGFIKHVMESLFRRPTGGGFYVTNGCMIAAAYGAGFKVVQCDRYSPSAFFNISTRDVTRLQTADFGTGNGRIPHPPIRLQPVATAADTPN